MPKNRLKKQKLVYGKSRETSKTLQTGAKLIHANLFALSTLFVESDPLVFMSETL